MGFFEKMNHWASRSISLKLITIGIIVLVLMIPSSMLNSLVYERQSLRDGAITEVSGKWGSEQQLIGPILTIPYKSYIINEKKERIETLAYAHFFPDSLAMNGVLKPDKRYRGIYVVVLYNLALQLKANFRPINLRSLGLSTENILLDQAFVSVGISDLKGIKKSIVLKIANQNSTSFGPGIPTNDLLKSGISTQLPVKLNESLNLSFDLDLNGSKLISFVPIGKETIVQLKSSWDNPSFDGSFLPENRTVSDSGFTADWHVLELNRNFPQQGLGKFVTFNGLQTISTDIYSDAALYPGTTLPDIDQSDSAFGVKLLLPIDEYQKTLRSSKYSTMFILLTFLVVFFAEIFRKKKVHPIQYLLTGSAICLFYVLLLSLSEHLLFDQSYLISCVVILVVIGFYVQSIFKNLLVTAFILGILAILYGFFYSLLQLQDYALLMGSIGLLVVLVIVMYSTRNIDWYHSTEEEQA
ncbi:MAG: cell envelope integrity protein CreD [Cytophagales bacterium]